MDKLNLDGHIMKRMEGSVSKSSFASILMLNGEGTIYCQGETLRYKKGDSFFLSAGSGDYVIEGSCDALITTIREKAAPVRIGIDLWDSFARIGVVDVHSTLLAADTLQIDTLHLTEEMIKVIAEKAAGLLGKQGIRMEQCVGIGIAVHGTTDIDIPKELMKYISMPVCASGDAGVIGAASLI